MIAWLEPVISGEMMFTAQTVQTFTDIGFTVGSTTGQTIDVTGTTWTSSYSYTQTGTIVTGEDENTGLSTTTTSGEDSGQTTSQQTYTLQTSTTTTFDIGSTYTIETALETTKWTTASVETGEEGAISFFTTATTVLGKTTSFETSSSTALQVEVLSDSTVVANTFNTVILCNHSEVAMILTENSYWSDWDGIGFAADNTTTGTRLTMSASVSTLAIQLFDQEETSITEEQSSQTMSSSVSYQTTNDSTTETLTRYTYSILPNSTQSYTQRGQSIVNSQTEGTTTLVYPFNHHGNTSTEISFVRFSTTQLQVLLNGNTYSELASALRIGVPESLVKTTVTLPNDYTFATVQDSDITVQAGGNSTRAANEHLLELQARQQEGLFAYDFGNFGIAHIVKPYGILDADNSGGFATINATSFSIPHLAYVNRQVPLMNFQNARALRTLTEYSDDSATISGNTITYTVTGTQKTESQEIAIGGNVQTGVVATKFVLGGTPEESATIYQSCPRGVFSLVRGSSTTTTVMGGDSTSIAPEESQETSVILPIPYITLKGRTIFGVNAVVYNNQVIPSYSRPEYEYQSQSAY